MDTCLLLFLLLAGCGGMNGKTRMETEGPELEISIAWWGDENRNEYMQELLGIYEQQNPGISFRPVPLGAEDYEEYLAVTAAAGESPDIMQMNGKLLTVYERNHTLADWQAAAGEGIQKELPIDTALMDTGKRGGIQAGIPVSVSIPGYGLPPLYSAGSRSGAAGEAGLEKFFTVVRRRKPGNRRAGAGI